MLYPSAQRLSPEILRASNTTQRNRADTIINLNHPPSTQVAYMNDATLILCRAGNVRFKGTSEEHLVEIPAASVFERPKSCRNDQSAPTFS